MPGKHLGVRHRRRAATGESSIRPARADPAAGAWWEDAPECENGDLEDLTADLGQATNGAIVFTARTRGSWRKSGTRGCEVQAEGDASGQYRVNLKAGDGEIIATRQNYATKPAPSTGSSRCRRTPQPPRSTT